MIFSLVRRELRGKYKGSALGFLWTFINPLLQLLVYTMVFSVIMRNGIKDYYLFLFVALIPWMFFSTCISVGCNCIMAQKEMIKKIYFPREVIPISFVTAQFVNMLLCFVVVFAALIVSGRGVSGIALLFLPVIMLVEYLLATGFTLLLSAITVYLRDIGHIMGILALAWQFLTPIMYSQDIVPDRIRPVFNLNPMAPVIIAYRDILYFKKAPHFNTLGASVVTGAALLVMGIIIFDRLQRHFAENL